MRALAVIEAEHRNMRLVANALGALAERLAVAPTADDLHTVALIADYLDAFPARYHHPKESNLLFAQIRRRTRRRRGGARSARSRAPDLSAAGRAHPRARRDGQRQRPSGRRRLIEESASFCATLEEHMQLEEEIALPTAQRVLLSEDWATIDAAFAAHRDPLGDPRADGDIALLRARIIQLVPAPEGVGGHSETVVTRLPRRGLDAAGPLLEISGLDLAATADRSAARRRREGRLRRAGRAGGGERRRQDHAAALHFGRPAGRGGRDPLRRRGHYALAERGAGARRHRAGAGRPTGVRADVGRGQSAARRLHAPGARSARQPRRGLRAFPDPARAARPGGGHAFGRPAADAGARPRDDEQAQAVAARRTVDGARAAGRRRDLPHRRRC